MERIRTLVRYDEIKEHRIVRTIASTYPINKITINHIILVTICILSVVYLLIDGSEDFYAKDHWKKPFDPKEFYEITMRKIRQEELKLIQTNRQWKEEKIHELTLEAIARSNFAVPADISQRPLIIYAYAESNFARANLQYFIQHGLYAAADFLFIINGNATLDLLLPPRLPNVRIIRRGNNCFDMGGIGEVLNSNDRELVKKYSKFILMNASVRGPFLPTWAEGCWVDKFLGRLSDEVKLVGTTYNCGPIGHVQSMVFATDRIGINVLLNGNITTEQDPNFLGGLSSCVKDKDDAISIELSLTNLIRKANYKVEVLMTQAKTSDTYYEKCDEGGWQDVHAYETIFVKTNSNYNVEFDSTNKLTELHNYWGRTSWDMCKVV